MPLIKGKSDKAFKENIRTEYKEGKPLKQSLAIAYAMKRKAGRKKMAEGGEAPKEDYDDMKARQAKEAAAKDPSNSTLKTVKSMASAFAHGGKVAEKKSGYVDHEGNDVKHNGPAMHEEEKKLNQHKVSAMDSYKEDLVDRIMNKESRDYSQLDRLAMGGEVDGESYEDCEQDMVDRIMRKHSMAYSDLDRYSEGGKVANQEHGHNNNELAGFSPNEFDDLVLRDDLESRYGDDDNSGDALGNEQEDEDRRDIVARIMRSRAKKDRNPRPA